MFDTVFVALSTDSVNQLVNEAAAIAWVQDAFAHCKVIGATREAKPLLDATGIIADEGVIITADPNPFFAAAAKGRIWVREPKVRTIF